MADGQCTPAADQTAVEDGGADSETVLVLTPITTGRENGQSNTREGSRSPASSQRNEFARVVVLRGVEKVGRAVHGKARPSKSNIIFDSKVLSRAHAEIWADGGKVYIRDTKSSNGTYINDRRLSASGVESQPFELKTGDRLKLGVDVTESNSASHRCVQLIVSISSGAISTDSLDALEDGPDLTSLQKLGEAALVDEIKRLRAEARERRLMARKAVTDVDGTRLHDAELQAQLDSLSMLMDELDRLSTAQLETLQENDKLVSRIDLLETQLSFYTRRAESESAEVAALKNELNSTREKLHETERSSKGILDRLTKEKAEFVEKVDALQAELSADKRAHEEEKRSQERAHAATQKRLEEVASKLVTEQKANQQATARLKIVLDSLPDTHKPSQATDVSLLVLCEAVAEAVLALTASQEGVAKMQEEDQEKGAESQQSSATADTSEATAADSALESDPSQRVKSLEEDVDQLQQQLVAAQEERDSALAELKQARAQASESPPSVSATAPTKDSAPADDLERKLEQAQQQITALQNECDVINAAAIEKTDKLSRQVEELEASVEEKTRRVDALLRELHDARAEEQRQTQAKQELEAKLLADSEAKAASQGESKSLLEENEKLKQELSSLQASLKQAQTDLATAQDTQQSTLAEQRSQNAAKVAELEQKLSTMAAELEGKASDAQKATQEVETVRTQLRLADERAQTLDKTVNELTSKIESFKTDAKKHGQELKKLQSQLSTAQQSQQDAEAERDKLANKRSELLKQNKQLRADIEELRQAKGSLEAAAKEHEAKLLDAQKAVDREAAAVSGLRQQRVGLMAGVLVAVAAAAIAFTQPMS